MSRLGRFASPSFQFSRLQPAKGTSRRRKSFQLQFETLENRHLLAANVVTDQFDYFPGETAQITASNFGIGETVRFQVLHIDGTPNTGNGHEPWDVTDGVAGDFNGDGIMDGDLDLIADGNIKTSWFVDPDDSAGATFELSARGITFGQVAHTIFTDDGNDSPTNIAGDPLWLDVKGTNPITTINAPTGFFITKVAIKSGSETFGVPEPDNLDPGDDNTGDSHSGVIAVDGTYGLGNGYTVSGLGTGVVTVTQNSGSKEISHVDYLLAQFVASPAINIEKLVNGQDADSAPGPTLAVGSTATFTYVVTNTGNVPLSNVVVVDDNGTPGVPGDDFNPFFVGGDTNNNGQLDLNEAWTYTASRVVTPGQHTNIGKVTGQSSIGQMVMDTDPANHFGAAPAIDIEKLVNGQDADSAPGSTLAVGSTATFTYVVTNTGNVPLSNVVVVDDNGTPGVPGDDFNPFFVGGDTNNNGLLDLNETWTYTASRIVTAGQHTNIGKVTGQSSIGQMVMDTDPANHFGQDCVIIIGPDKGNKSAPLVKVINKDTGNVIVQFYAYETTFLGGVRLATGDMDGDGIDEIITAPGQGRVGEVRVFTQNGVELPQFRTVPYGSSYKGGIEVAVGDVNGDGKTDIVTTNSSGRTDVRVFYNSHPALDPIPNAPSKQFFAFASSFKGGADVVIADVGTFLNGVTIDAATPDGKGEIVIGNGPGMRSTILVYDVTGTPSILDTVLPFSNSFKGGITLSAARINADAIPDFIVAAGNGGGSAVQIWSGLTNDGPGTLLAAFNTFADTSTKNAPVHATAFDTNGDGIADVIAAVQGTNGKSNQIRRFQTNGAPLGTISGFTGPWNIASSCDMNPTPQNSLSLAATDGVFTQLGNQLTSKVKKPKLKIKKR